MIQSQLLSRIPHLVHGYSDRTDGNMSIKASEIQHKLTGDFQNETFENRLRFYKLLNVDEANVVLSRQTHHTNVEYVSQTHRGRGALNGSPFETADSLYTRESDTYLSIFSADCLPIFIVDRQTKTVAAVHAGWRGIAGNIIKNTIERLVASGAEVENCQVWIGPHIQACHYRVDTDAPSYQEKLDAFRAVGQAFVEKDDSLFLDLTTLAVRQLEEQGIARDHIEVGDCTACHPDRYFSYYMDKGNVSGIMMGVIGWKGDV